MKTRSQIEEKYKWDLTDIIKDEAEINKIFKKMQKLAEVYPNYDGKLANKELLLEKFSKYEKDLIEINKLYFYLHNKYSEDSSNTEILKLIQKFETYATMMSNANAYFEPQLYELSDEYLNSLLEDKRFKKYTSTIKDVIKNKPHKIDEKTNKLLTKMQKFLGDNSHVARILNDSEIEFKDATDSKGKIHKVDNSTYLQYIKGHDPKLRETTFASRNGAGKQFNKTFTELYIKDIELDKFYTKLQNFDTVLDSVLFNEDVPKSVFENVVKHVNKNIPLLQEYVKHVAKISGNKNFAYQDLFEDHKIGKKITIEQAKQTMLDALSPLGEDYIAKVKTKLNDRSIDFLANKDKRTGAYCSNCYGAKTLILMNYLDDFDSVSTLCHEMGHCINAEYYNGAQNREDADITIFSAEIASTVNEILLTQYMLKKATKKEKAYYLHEFLDGVRSTIYRQTLFAEFELFAHGKVENDEPVTHEDLNNAYMQLNKKYYGKACKLPSALQYEWARIPHFYTAYYVYSYATGMITAISIANRVLNEKGFAEKYIKFLKNGTKRPAVDVLKEIGIDLTSDEPFEQAFKFVKQQFAAYKDCTK